MKVVRKQAKIFAVFFVVLLGLVLLMLRGQNGDVLQILVLEQQIGVDSASPLGLGNILNPGQKFEILFPNYGENIAGGNSQGSYWKVIEGNGCTLLEKNANNGSGSTRYSCTYPKTGTMTIKIRKCRSAICGDNGPYIGAEKTFTIP